jgi:hypothetical protein
MIDRQWTTHNMDAINFAIRLTPFGGCSEHGADFEVYEIIGWSLDRSQRFYRRRGGESLDMVERIEEAGRFASGYVKWDGCLEFRMAEEESLHMCGRGDGENFGKMLVAIWDFASKMVPMWDHRCAGTAP